MAKLLVILLVAALVAVASASLQSDMLRVHNAARATKGLAPLKWDAAIAKTAQTHAKSGPYMVHKVPKNCGQNLAAGSSWAYDAPALFQLWMNEAQYYSCGTKIDYTNFQQFGHYTQVMWSATKYVGCGLAVRGDNNFLVCNYRAPGNVVGQAPYTKC